MNMHNFRVNRLRVYLAEALSDPEIATGDMHKANSDKQ
jgi:hypothetical protein